MSRKSHCQRHISGLALMLSWLLAVMCLAHTAAWAQNATAGKPVQSPIDIPMDIMPPQTGVKGDNPDLPAADQNAQKIMATVQDKYKSELKKDCLPLPDNLNINDNLPFSVIPIIDQFKGEPCEMMNEIKFHLDEKRGKNAGQIAFELIKIKLPDEGDIFEGLAKTFAKRALPGVNIYTTLGDVKDLFELIDSEIVSNRLHGQYTDAVAIYRLSKGWSMSQLEKETGSLNAELKRKMRDVEKLEAELYSECLKQYPSYEELRVFGPQFKPGTNIPNEAEIWRRYNERISSIEQKYDPEIRKNLRGIAGIDLKIKFLQNYRKPLIEKPCDQRIQAVKPGCPQKNKADEASKPPEPPKNTGALDQTNKNALNGCLCRCTINPTIGVGATYDPKAWKNASPSCDDARYGPCVGFGLGCWREHMRSDGECFEQCVTAAGAKPQEVKTEIYQTRFKAYNDFLGEARSIIEEYLAYKAKFSEMKPYHGIDRAYVQLAGNFPDDMSLNRILSAAAAPASSPSSYADMVRQKNRRGDPDRALGLVRSAESVMPDRKASGETTNILAEFAIIMSKASLNIVTEFEFDEGLYLLRKAAEFYKVGKSNPLGQEMQRLISAFEKWKEDWQILKSQIPVCQALIKEKRVCACDKLNSEKITPAANSLTIYEFASSEKWSISTANGTPRPLPEKDKIYRELKDTLSRAKNECANNTAMNTKEMKDLTDYETRKSLEKSPYINQEALKKNSAPVICDTRAVKYAEKLLSAPGLCDCQQEKIKGILDTAKKDERPLVIEFSADKKELSVGERVVLSLSIKGGVSPFSADMIGDYPYTQQSEARGFSINYQAEKSGTNTFYVTVVDACGDSGSKKVYLNVKPDREIGTENKPKVEQKMTVALSADKTQLKVNERTYVHVNVQNHKPPYTLRWGGYAQGLGDQGGKVPFVGAPQPGTYTVTADVTDAGGRRATGSIELTVTGETTSKPPVKTSLKIGQSKIIVVGSNPETSISPLKLNLPPGEQSQPLLFTYEHKNINSDKMQYIIQAPSATTFKIEPSDSGASLTRISKPEKWGKEKLFAVNINKDVKPGRKFTLTAYYSGVPNPQWIYSKYIDTGEDTEEYLKKNVKPATAIIEVIKGSASYQNDKGYNPLDDINITEPDNKTVDVAAVDKIGNEFQGDQTGVKQKESPKDKQPPPVSQSETYTGSTKKPDNSSGSQNTYSPPYIDDNRPPGKNWTDWTKSKGDKRDRGEQSYGSSGADKGSSSKANCDTTQKQAAYQEGFKCGQKAKQNNGAITAECKAASQKHMNTDTKMGWGSCLYSGFDEGYRAGLGTTAGGGSGEVMAELENRAGESVHIFADGQDNFGPQNKLAPGAKKTVSIKVPKGGGYVKFLAGRNGQKLAECKWEYTPDSWSRVPVVKFSAPKSLTCTVGLR